jgi:hypothetical protein
VLSGSTSDVIEKRLRIFENIRENRGSVLAVFSNVGQDEPEKIHAVAPKFIPAAYVTSMFFPSIPTGLVLLILSLYCWTYNKHVTMIENTSAVISSFNNVRA